MLYKNSYTRSFVLQKNEIERNKETFVPSNCGNEDDNNSFEIKSKSHKIIVHNYVTESKYALNYKALWPRTKRKLFSALLSSNHHQHISICYFYPTAVRL